MKSRHAERLLTKCALPHLPNYGVRGKFLYRLPIEWILRGYYIDQGSSSDWIRIWVPVQPLYVPHNDIYFTLGSSLGNLSGGAQKWWQVVGGKEEQVMADILNDIRREGESYLARFGTPAAVEDGIQELGALRNVHVHEALAYSRALCWPAREALKTIEELQSHLRERLDIPWIVEMMERTRMVAELLRTDPAGVVSLMKRWRRETLAAVNLLEVAVSEDLLPVPASESASRLHNNH